ncbi:MAG: hypothetical protein U0Z26_00440 [Anaerolineales bacterium]
MKPRIKMGLIVGGIGLVLNACISGAIGICGPFASLIAGGIAGYFAANQEKLFPKSEGAKAGGIAGGIAGGLMIIGQLIGGMVALAYMQYSGAKALLGTMPQSGDTTQMAIFYGSGLLTGVCFGLFGAALAAGAGAAAGYIATPDQAAPVDNTPMQ